MLLKIYFKKECISRLLVCFIFMGRCLSYLNSMSDIVYKKIENFSSYNNVQYYCFQSAEIKESGGSFSDNYYLYYTKQ